MRYLSAFTVILLCPLVASAANPVRDLQERAEEALDSGKFDEAGALYRKIGFVQPSKKARKGLKKVLAKQTKSLIKTAKKAVKKEPKTALKLANKILEIDPGSKDGKKLMKKLGYVCHLGAWISKKELEWAKDADAKRGEFRRKEIGLPDEFVIMRRDVFRFYTNVDLKYGAPILEQMFSAMVSHYYKFREVMGPLGVRIPREGLDVILFDDERDYLNFTKASGSAGVYIPRKSAGFFFSGASGFNFPTMLHEMTHQLNGKVLEATATPPWYEEGISEYFGAGLLRNKGTSIQLGLPDRSRMSTFRGMVNAKPSLATPLPQFFSAARAELTSEYYAQSWALTHYLMEGPAVGRLILFDILVLAKAKRQQFGVKLKDIEEILARYDVSLASLETAYQAFQNGESTTLQASSPR
jgi:hypothetical protein